jgi:benzoyl-CoA reductase subunit B
VKESLFQIYIRQVRAEERILQIFSLRGLRIRLDIKGIDIVKGKKIRRFEIFKYAKRFFQLGLFFSKFGWLSSLAAKFIVRPILFNKENKYNSLVRQAFCFAGGSSIPPEEFKALVCQMPALIKYATDVIETDRTNKPVVWVDWCFSHEILRAFDVVPFVAESPVLMAAWKGTDYASRIIEEAEMEGMPAEICSGSKSTLGSYMLGQSPEPDLIISTTHPCDSIQRYRPISLSVM